MCDFADVMCHCMLQLSYGLDICYLMFTLTSVVSRVLKENLEFSSEETEA